MTITHTITSPTSADARKTFQDRNLKSVEFTSSPTKFSMSEMTPNADAIHHSTTPANNTTTNAIT